MKKLTSIKILKAKTRQQLLGKYGVAIFSYIIVDFILSTILSVFEMMTESNQQYGNIIYYLAYFLVYLLSAIFIVGQNKLYLNIAEGKDFAISDLWFGFRTVADKAIVAQLFIFLKTGLFALPLLVCIAGYIIWKDTLMIIAMILSLVFFLIGSIVIMLDYSQVFFILGENTQATTLSILTQSKALMKGNRLHLLKLICSFFGMLLLILLSFGIGIFWVYPYFHVSLANFYTDLKNSSY